MLRHAHSVLPTAVAILLAVALSGCMGGPIAQQIASSIATRVADKVVGDMVDEQLRKEREPRRIDLMNTEPDPFVGKFLTMQFPDPQPPEIVIEPLPTQAALSYAQPNAHASRLVSVEIWNLVIGQEKQALLERSLQNGSTILPSPMEWRDWQLATGSLQGHTDAQLYFLVPPDFGRISSGDRAIVEIADTGGLHIARYRVN